jgi:hypothetical protein
VKIKDGQQWEIEIHHRKLRYRHIGKARAARPKEKAKSLEDAYEQLKEHRTGDWRRIKDKHDKTKITIWWKIKEGKSSGLPWNLFHPLQECILDSAMKITRDSRTFRNVRRPLRRDLAKGAALIGCEMSEESKTHCRFSLKHKPAMEFLLYDYQSHKPEEFFKQDGQHNVVKNKKGMPMRALGKLAERLRQHKTVRDFEQNSKALLRWLVVVFAPSTASERNIWLVPAKASKRGD